jgi:hypothetical protein
MTTLLTLHIILMTTSLIGTAGMALAAVSSVKVDSLLIRSNAAVTAIGTVCGIVLLFAEPVGVKCIVLASYVALFALTYSFVLGRNQSLSASSAL